MRGRIATKFWEEGKKSNTQITLYLLRDKQKLRVNVWLTFKIFERDEKWIKTQETTITLEGAKNEQSFSNAMVTYMEKKIEKNLYTNKKKCI